MAHKGKYVMRKVVREFQARSLYAVTHNTGNMTIYTFEELECGHVREQPEIRETAKMIRFAFARLNGVALKRRCFECVDGQPMIPQPYVTKEPNA